MERGYIRHVAFNGAGAIHDFELAQALNCDHILISAGHQSTTRLREHTRNILSSILEIPDFIFRSFPKRKLVQIQRNSKNNISSSLSFPNNT